MDQGELVKLALESMHALNRRAKMERDRRNRFRRQAFSGRIAEGIDEIYDLKDRLLHALVVSGVAQVGQFSEHRERESSWTECSSCGNTWGPGGGLCRDCDVYGDEMEETHRTIRTWYVVSAHGYRWHMPASSASKAIRAAAQGHEVEAHDPTQPAREIPRLRYSLAAQRGSIELAIELLLGSDADSALAS